MNKIALTLSVSLLALISIGISVKYCNPIDTSDTIVMSTTAPPKAGMVAAANPYAVQAGVDILNAGGSAVDAAIAVQTTLGLVEPQSSGLGGGAFLLTYDSKTGEVWNYDGRETAPADATDALFLGEDGEPLRYFDAIASGRSTGVPSAMVMLHRAHEDYGNLKWGAGGQFDFAQGLAQDGFNVPGRMASTAARMAKFVLGNNEAARNYFFLPDGTTITEGQLIKNPDYSDVLQALKSNPRALLEGPIAAAIIDEIRKAPLAGTLTLEDMARYQPEKTEPLCSPYREHMVCGPQPPSSGGVAVQSILGTLENFDMTQKGQSAEGWHHFIEASFLAYADRNQFAADPRFIDVPTKAMRGNPYPASL